MPNVKNNASAQETCRKLLDAAGEIFADRGVHAATIKMITDKAGVNVAAVNYHFSDKFELYLAVIRNLIDTDGRAAIPTDLGVGPAPDRLRRFVRHFLESTLSRHANPAWKPLLMARELAQPTAAFDYMTENVMKPLLETLEPIVEEILGSHATTQRVRLYAGSILGQCLYYLHDRNVIERFHPDLMRLARKTKNHELADHIVDFSLAALNASSTKRRSSRKTTSTSR